MTDAGMDGIVAHVRVAIEQLGEWEVRSQDDLDGSRPEHREAMVSHLLKNSSKSVIYYLGTYR